MPWSPHTPYCKMYTTGSALRMLDRCSSQSVVVNPKLSTFVARDSGCQDSVCSIQFSLAFLHLDHSVVTCGAHATSPSTMQSACIPLDR